jgi:hypothetical protein
MQDAVAGAGSAEPGPPPVVIIAPEPTPTVTRVLVAKRSGHDLVLAKLGDATWLLEPVQLPSGNDAFLARGKNLLANPDIQLLAPVDLAIIAGESTANYGLDEPASFPGLPGYRFDRYEDGAKYWEKSDRPDLVNYNQYLAAKGIPPAPHVVVRPAPLPFPIAVSEGSDDLSESSTPSVLSDMPFGYDRMQVEHPEYEDGWQMKMGSIAQVNAPGFPNETPELLQRHGINEFDATFFYGSDGLAPWGLPKKEDKLFFEAGGGIWDPYRDPFSVLATDMQTIGNNLSGRMPGWNSVKENGLIDGVPTVKECHFNTEYAWLQDAPPPKAEPGTYDPKNFWATWTDQQRNQRIVNYAQGGREETLQEIYNRGGVDELNAALHQKWANIHGLSILMINRISGIRAYVGDGAGIAPMHYLQYYPGNASDLLSADVNDASRFQDANQNLNGGKLTIAGQVYDLTGNLKQIAGKSHCYHYEWAVEISAEDREKVLSGQGGTDIRVWHTKMRPELYRPYDKAFHAQLTNYVENKKGWVHPVLWQTEVNYENAFLVDGQEIAGDWLGWTINQPGWIPSKVPLHPEVCNSIVYNARMNLQGLYLWEAFRRQNLPIGKSEHTHPTLHQTAREGLQRALDEINQHRVFGPDTVNMWDTIRIRNEARKEWFAGDASQLLLRNGRNSAGKPANPIPLVTGVYRPSTRTELYSVYYPHPGRYDQSLAHFKSPIDGKELTARATGWGPTLWTRQR